MDQSKSSNTNDHRASAKAAGDIPMPRRTVTVEFIVGVFTLVGCAAAGYLAIGLGGLKLGHGNTYEVVAEFDNVSGLKYGASVEIGGVPIGEVSEITLNDPMALVRMRIDNSVKLRDDDVLSVRTKGIIGDRYIKVSRGGSGEEIQPGGKVYDTESVVDIEDLIGKFIHNLDSGKEEEGEKNDGKGVFPEDK